MHAFIPRRAAGHALLALAIGLAAVLPGPLLAATPSASVTDRGASTVTRVALDEPTDGNSAGGPLTNSGLGPVWRFEARLAALDAIAVAQGSMAAAALASTVAPVSPPVVQAAAPKYVGKNHLWIPALGMSRSVATFACTRSTPPANQVYRWGCAGTNNVYLFGHAWGVMKPVHDAYVAGRLKKGMVVIYADGAGRVRTFRVTETRVVTPDQTSWAIAGQSRLSMTLQTCLGATSQWRLLVRLVADR